jgi:cytochrome c oxidase assembly protein subunit 15
MNRRWEPVSVRWVHYWAWFTCAWALLVVSIGGLVTSKGVGMAVPDWPTTYGYNMFFFPISQWTGGIFHEHVHRLAASLLGLWTIVLAVGLQWGTARRWVRALGWLALGLVVVQGVLGGKRVVLNAVDVLGIPGSIFFGVLHATTAQVFLSLLATLVLGTSPRFNEWLATRETSEPRRGVEPRMGAWLACMAALVFVQLTVAASMRHQHAGLAVPDFPLAYGRIYPSTDSAALAAINQRRTGVVDDAPVTAFQVHLHMVHRFVAVVLVAGAAWTWRRAARLGRGSRLAVRAWTGLFAVQFALGAATVWTNKAADLATAHVAVGASILAVGVALATMRLLGERPFRVAFGPCGATDAFIKPCATVAVGRPA